MPRKNFEFFQYTKTVECKRKRIMAKVIKFVSPEEKTLFIIKDHIVDIVKNFTIIISKDLFTKYRIFDQVESLDIDPKRVRVNYSTGAYLLIKP